MSEQMGNFFQSKEALRNTGNLLDDLREEKKWMNKESGEYEFANEQLDDLNEEKQQNTTSSETKVSKRLNRYSPDDWQDRDAAENAMTHLSDMTEQARANLGHDLVFNGFEKVFVDHITEFDLDLIDQQLLEDMLFRIIGGSWDEVAFEKFKNNINQQRFIKRLIDDGNNNAVIENLEKFDQEGVNYKKIFNDILDGIVDREDNYDLSYLTRSLNKFHLEVVEHCKLFDILLKFDDSTTIVQYIDNFIPEAVDLQRLIDKLPFFVLEDTLKFLSIISSDATKMALVDFKKILAVFTQFSHFDEAERFIIKYQQYLQAEDYQHFIDKMIDKGGHDRIYFVRSKFDTFPGVKFQDVMNKLARTDNFSVINDYISGDKSLTIEQQTCLMNLLMKKGMRILINNITKFQNSNQQDIINELFLSEDSRISIIIGKLEQFPSLNHQNIANKLIETPGWIHMVSKNLKKFQNLTIEGFRQVPEVEAFLSEFEAVIPNIAQKITIEQLLEIMSQPEEDRQKTQQLLKQTPFLAEAFLENKYAIKLILKYPTLDQESKENITFLYNAKSEKENIDPNTPAFRTLDQDKLKTYKNNASILEAIQEKGVNTEQWLNYSHQESFDLGKEDETSFAERIKLPITRLTETQVKYIASFKETLKPSREQLSKLSVQEDIEPLQSDLQKMQQEQEKTQTLIDQEQSKPESEQDAESIQRLEKKLKGLPRGIASLQQRIEHPKSVPAWDRIMGEIASLERTMEFVRLSSEALTSHDTEIQNLKDNPSPENRKKLIEMKLRGLALEKKFRQDLSSLEKTIFGDENANIVGFEEKQSALLTKLLGEDAKNSIINLFHEVILEDRDHIHADVSSLKQLIEDEEKEAQLLEGTPMSIEMCNRNPDEDLYLGNYTDCCIRIDSDHMGAESTIADYLTDLGIQIITVRDEKKNIPVVAAWSWIGRDAKTNEAVLVIDNIEANTEYSIPFQSQISEKLKQYFEDLAKSIGVKKIVQGEDNNDLTIFSMDRDCVKLGGYNREGGYFLEGESNEEDDA